MRMVTYCLNVDLVILLDDRAPDCGQDEEAPSQYTQRNSHGEESMCMLITIITLPIALSFHHHSH